MTRPLIRGGDTRGDFLRVPQFRFRRLPCAALHRQFADDAMGGGEGEEVVVCGRVLQCARRARQRAGRLATGAIEGGPGEVMLSNGGDVDASREERSALVQRRPCRRELMV